MSAGRLIFSFSDGRNLAINTEEIARGTVIRFGDGFQDMEMLYDDRALRLMSQEEVRGKVPAVEFSIKSEAPILPAAFCKDVAENKKGPLTKTQSRNQRRKFKAQLHKLEEEIRTQGLTRDPESFTPDHAIDSAEIPPIPEYTPADVIPEHEEYIPQYVQRAPPRQVTAKGELERVRNVRRRKFEHFQRIKGEWVNILQGLELHKEVFSEIEQTKIVRTIYGLRDKGRAGLLQPRTYSEPRKWMKGKGRITIQFGCCYNYATDANGNLPGIIRHEDVDPIPPLLQHMIRRMVAWHVLPAEVTPDSCIVNIYEEGDCIPPHIDSHDFVRPFCTASFLGECDILLGTELRIKGPGEFSGSARIPLPVGSVLVFKGNGADVAKHCVPAVPRSRISITFRKMDPQKQPHNYVPEPELQGLRPLVL